MIPLPDRVHRALAALLVGDAAAAATHCAADVTCHIGGNHPLSGAYRGVAQIRELRRRTDEVAGRHHFTVTNVMSDDTGAQVLVEGVARNGTYARHVITRLRFDGDRLAELWVRPLDQRAEDEFWRARVPLQRDGGSPAASEARSVDGTGAWTGNGG